MPSVKPCSRVPRESGDDHLVELLLSKQVIDGQEGVGIANSPLGSGAHFLQSLQSAIQPVSGDQDSLALGPSQFA